MKPTTALTLVCLLTADVELYNPREMLCDQSQPEYAVLRISHNPATDIGAYEYIPPPTLRIPEDLTLDQRVTLRDYYWFWYCWRGPEQPFPTTVVLVRDHETHSIGCWMADHDFDGDVDLADFQCQQMAVELREK